MSLPSFGQITDFVTKTKAAVDAITAKNSTLSGDVQAALPALESAAETALSVYFPGLSLFGIPAGQIVATAKALADPSTGPAAPIKDAFNNLEAAISGGPEPTAEAWAVFDARAVKAHDDWKAALAAA